MSEQSIFNAALLDPDRPVPDGLLDGQGNPAGRRFSVYRNNVAVSLTEALEAAFPVIVKLIGIDNFKPVAGVYLRAHPPQTPLMMQYGESFPAFLAGFEPLSHLGYLADMARFELAMHRAYHAADASLANPEIFSTTPPENLANLHLTLAPSVQLLHSDWPIFAIWEFNTVKDAPPPEAVAQDVLITRAEFDPAPRLLAPGGASFIAALKNGKCLGDAAEAGTATFHEFDLSALLAVLLQDSALSHVTLKETP